MSGFGAEVEEMVRAMRTEIYTAFVSAMTVRNANDPAQLKDAGAEFARLADYLEVMQDSFHVAPVDAMRMLAEFGMDMLWASMGPDHESRLSAARSLLASAASRKA